MLRTLLTLTLVAGLTACSTAPEIHPSNDFPNNGRDTWASKRDALYVAKTLDDPLPAPRPEFAEGLNWQARYLSRKSLPEHFQFEDLSLSRDQLQRTVAELQRWQANPSVKPALRAYELKGDDSRGNVQFTGYYAPVIKVRNQPDASYRYPLYRMPSTPKGTLLPSREQIDFEGALNGQGLELAWSASLVDNFFLHVQGSGVVEYDDGRRELLSYAGVNGHGYRSLGKYLIEIGEIPKEQMSAQAIVAWLQRNPQRAREVMSKNPSYVFFTRGQERVVGAANVPLIPDYSIAVDPKVIPLGAVVLAEVPVLDREGQLIRHEPRLMIAQDKGGAIKGPGHVDVYKGIGADAQHRAGQLKHYGRIWLLLAD